MAQSEPVSVSMLNFDAMRGLEGGNPLSLIRKLRRVIVETPFILFFEEVGLGKSCLEEYRQWTRLGHDEGVAWGLLIAVSFLCMVHFGSLPTKEIVLDPAKNFRFDCAKPGQLKRQRPGWTSDVVAQTNVYRATPTLLRMASTC